MEYIKCFHKHSYIFTELFESKFQTSWLFSNNTVFFSRKRTYSYIISLFFKIRKFNIQFSSVQSLSRSLRPHESHAARQASPFITISRSSLRLTSIESVMPSSHLILGHPLLLLPPIPPSIRVFSNESTLLMRWPKYWSFSFSIFPSKEIPGLISFRMDWLGK